MVLVAFVLDVTVTVVKQTTPIGVPVILKFVLALVVPGLLAVKTVAPEPSSFFTTTSIVTPCGGIVDVIETVSGKSI